MKILFGIQSFESLTGSELYVYELSKELIKQGHSITVAAKYINGILTHKAQSEGIRVVHLYNLPNEDFDILHLNQYQPAKILTTFYPFTPAIMTMHTEVYAASDIPYLHPNIYKYLCVRPAISKIMESDYDINPTKLLVVFNGIDADRFNSTLKKSDSNTIKNILIVGTINHLRIKLLEDLVHKSAIDNFKITVVGNVPSEVKKHYQNNISITFNDPVYEVQKFLIDADETAGVLLGRTTIEGWFADKPGWIYDIDNQGNIISKELHYPPDNLEKYTLSYAAKNMLILYNNATQEYALTKNEYISKMLMKYIIRINLHIKYGFYKFKRTRW